MRGAIVFLAAFLLFIVITFGYRALPPGEMIYEAVVGADLDYEVASIPATLLAIAVFNGVVYGIIVYIIYWLAERFIFGKKTTIIIQKN